MPTCHVFCQKDITLSMPRPSARQHAETRAIFSLLMPAMIDFQLPLRCATADYYWL